MLDLFALVHCTQFHSYSVLTPYIRLDYHPTRWLRRGTHGGKEGESPACNCLGLSTSVVQTIYNKGYLLTIFLC
jgi:hypothetical protein